MDPSLPLRTGPSTSLRTGIELVTIGTELLLGFTVDTNSAFIGRTLARLGVRVVRRTSVGDEPAAIRAAVDDALTRTGFVLTTGGLGPTRDDMSKQAIAELLGMPLRFDDAVWQVVLERFTRAGRTPTESNRSQAMVPDGAAVLPNPWGSAPGLWLTSARGEVIMLPGVPFEMMKLVEDQVMPRLGVRSGGGVIRSATLRVTGIAESALAERIGTLEDALQPLSLAYLPGVAGVDLRLTAWNLEAIEAERALQDGIARLREVAGDYAYGEDDDDLAAILLDRMRSRHLTLSVAESCTGGLLGARITEIPGSSDVFLGGVVSYADQVKRDLLDVPEATIAAHGAVSAETAQAMVRGVKGRFKSDLAVSVTGIAGPGGGSPEKPVGTVWFAYGVAGKEDTVRMIFNGNRSEVRARAAQAALVGLLRRLVT